MPADNPSGFLRLFMAIPVPPAIRQEISRAQGRLRRETPPGSVRWTPAELFHITLKFLGDVPATQVAALAKSAGPICAATPALRLSAHRLGFFPGPQHPRVLWAGADDRDGRLSTLHHQLDTALNWLTPAEPQFTGHITLGRFKPGHHSVIPQLMELAARLDDRNFGDWLADAVELVRSDLASTGPTHTHIETFPLAQQPNFKT